MEAFVYREGRLYAEGVPLELIAARVGTPCYVYSRAHIESRWRAFDAAFGTRAHLVCYSVKANPTLSILGLVARLGGGFDIVSGGELARVLAAGGDATKTVFSGVGKTEAEMEHALGAGIRCFNVESEAELERLDAVARRLGRKAPVALRVNPDVDAGTHPYISTGLKQNKFGIPIARARAAYRGARGMDGIAVAGIACHIGSQLTQLAPFADAVDRVAALIKQLAGDGIRLRHIDLGGGVGIRYRDEEVPQPTAYVDALLAALDRHPASKGLPVLIEPGRALVGNAGVLLTRVEYLKEGEDRRFAVVDAAMNDLVRPALYDAWHDIVPVTPRAGGKENYDVVGPVCESGDFLGHGRALALAPGDLLAVRSAGAYGASMSSHYNTRPRVPEVMVDGERFHVVRRRERAEELFAPETLLPE